MAKTIDEIITLEDSAAITELKKGRLTELPDVKKMRSEYYILKHDIMDKGKRLDKEILNDAGQLDHTEPVNRIAVPFQKKIVNSAVAFTFGNEVKLKAEPKNDKEKQVLEAVKRILFDNKINSFTRKVAKDIMRATEGAEIWFPVAAEPHEDYGFPCSFRIRVKQFTVWLGEILYPYFDATDDMVAFSREYVVKEGDNKITYFETYTPTKRIVFQDQQPRIETPIEIGKIPVVFGDQEMVEWSDVQVCIDRLEKLLSNFAETIDYHAAPKIFTQGKILGFAKKGESGAIIEGEPGSDAKYLSWAQSPESVKLEIETLLRFIYGFTQTPDVSFDSVKGIQAISGEALKMLFMDAHLKVMDKKEIFDNYLQRRINIIKAYVGKLNIGLAKECSSLIIEPEIIPFMINDQKNEIEKMLLANGNKPIVSQKWTVENSGLSDKTDEEWTQIQAEAKEANTANIFAPTI